MGKIHYSCKQTNRAPTEIGRPHEAVAQNGITAEFMYLADGIVHGFLFPVMLVHFHSSLSLSAVHKFHVRYVQLIYRINAAIRLIHFQEKLSAVQLRYSIFDLITGELRQLIVVTQFIDSGIILFDLVEHYGKNRNTSLSIEVVVYPR